MKRFALLALLALAACEGGDPERFRRIHLRCFNPDGSTRLDLNVSSAKPENSDGLGKDIWRYDTTPDSPYFFVNGPCESSPRQDPVSPARPR